MSRAGQTIESAITVGMTEPNTLWQAALAFSSSLNLMLPGEGSTWKMLFLSPIVHFHRYALSIDKSPGTQHVKG